MYNHRPYSTLRSVCLGIVAAFVSLQLYGGTVRHDIQVNTGDLALTQVSADDGNTYTHVALEGYHDMMSPGEPGLQGDVIAFIVPTFSNGFSVRISGSDPETHILEHPLYPSQEPTPMSTLPSEIEFTRPSDESYRSISGALYSDVTDEQMLSGRYHLVYVKYSPMSYGSDDLTLTVYSNIHVELSYNECSENDMGIATDLSHPKQPIFPLEYLVVNPQDAERMIPSSGKDGMSKNPAPRQDEYHIIAPASLCDALWPLVVWKRQKGYKVVLCDIESIYSRFRPTGATGREDEAASLRQYLKTQYNVCTGDMFCLLVGSPAKTNMPIRYYDRMRHYQENLPINYEDFTPTDSYFANVTGNWTLVKNQHNNTYLIQLKQWLAPEIMIGRLLCSTPSEVVNFIDKLILYEGNPGRGDTEYLGNAFFVEQYKKGGSLINNSTRIRSTLSKNYNIILYQDKSLNNMVWPTGKDVIEKMRDCGFTSLHGHGNPAHVAISSGIQNQADNINFQQWRGLVPLQSYTSFDLMGTDSSALLPYPDQGLDLLDNFDKPCVVYSVSCDNAPMDILITDQAQVFDCQYNLAESFTVGGLYGGPAYLGNSRQGYIASSRSLEEHFASSLLDYPCIGRAELLSKTRYAFTDSISQHIKHTHYICGDPEFNIWIGEPITPSFAESRSSDLTVNFNSFDMSQGRLYRFDGQNGFTMESFNGSANLKPSSANNKLSASPFIGYAIWKQNQIPIISLRNASGNLYSGNFSFVVRDAILGIDNLNAGSSKFCIGGTSNVTIKAIDILKLQSGIQIKDNAKVNLKGHGNVSVGEVLISGESTVSISGESVTFGNGFNVSAGSTLSVNAK